MSDTKTAAVTDPNQVVLQDVNISYPTLFKPRKSDQGGEPKYSASFILDKVEHAAQIKQIKAIIDSILKEKNGGKPLGPALVCLRDGSMKPGVEGYNDDIMFITSSNSKRPQVVSPNREGRSPMDENDSRLVGGCRVNAVVRLWWQDNPTGKRINGSLSAVQYVRPDKTFGAAPVDTDSVFGAIPEPEMAGDLD